MISVNLSDIVLTKYDPLDENQTRVARNFRVFPRFRGFSSPMSAIEDLLRTMARLREPGGCPWDQEQTHASLVRCLIDEVSELIDTIDRDDMPHMREELGDVLIQIVFHARIAEEKGLFNFDDVAREINEKLVRRHPHVFGTGKLDTSEQVLVQWDAIKAQEKKNGPQNASRVFKDLPPRLPALMFAEAVWKQIEKKRLPAEAVVDSKQIAALAETLDDATLGRKLFELTAAARVKGLDPEGALRLHATSVMADVENKLAASSSSAAT
jgi:MazG family protein